MKSFKAAAVLTQDCEGEMMPCIFLGKKGRASFQLLKKANRTSKRKRGDMRNKEYMEAIKEQTQKGHGAMPRPAKTA